MTRTSIRACALHEVELVESDFLIGSQKLDFAAAERRQIDGGLERADRINIGDFTRQILVIDRVAFAVNEALQSDGVVIRFGRSAEIRDLCDIGSQNLHPILPGDHCRPEGVLLENEDIIARTAGERIGAERIGTDATATTAAFQRIVAGAANGGCRRPRRP